MIGREVQRVEVELLGLDLGAFGQLPAHRDERVGDMLGQDRDRVPGADRLTGRRQRDVDALGDEHGGVALGAQRGERSSYARCASVRATLTSLPASARSALGSEPSA